LNALYAPTPEEMSMGFHQHQDLGTLSQDNNNSAKGQLHNHSNVSNSSINLSGTMKAEFDLISNEVDLAKAREKEAHYEYENIQYKKGSSRTSSSSSAASAADDFQEEEMALRRIQKRVAELSTKARVMEADALAWEGKVQDAKDKVESVKADIDKKNKQVSYNIISTYIYMFQPFSFFSFFFACFVRGYVYYIF
jgi:hypothetical protein